MTLTQLVLLAVSGTALAGAPTSGTPTFECTDGEKLTYQIWLGSAQRRVRVIAPDKSSRDIPLSGSNVGLPNAPGGGPLVYTRWNAQSKSLLSQLDASTEVTVEYVGRKSPSQAKLGLVVDHRERLGLTCKASGQALAVVSMDSESTEADRLARYIAVVTGLRERDDTLVPLSVVRLEAAIRRWQSTPSLTAQPARGKFTEQIAPSIKLVDRRSVNHVTSRLDGAAAALWKSFLEEIRYKYYPDVERYTAWIKGSVKPNARLDVESFMAGFNEFVKYKGYNEKNIREYFITEVTPVLLSLSEEAVSDLRSAMPKESGIFLLETWSKAVGKRTLADFPEIISLARDIAGFAAAKGDAFDPQKIQRKISAFVKSPLAADEEAMEYFMQEVAPELKKLTPRQREDVLGWLEAPEEKQFFLKVTQ